MDIYCDESGGVNDKSGIFLAASVLIRAKAADRLIKRFKRRYEIVGEVKGSHLELAQREVFFDLLEQEQEFYSIAAICARSTRIGGWAFNKIKEADIYAHLLSESCQGLPRIIGGPILIKPDDGRYKKLITRRINQSLSETLERHFNAATTVQFSQSHNTPGIQIADVVANTVFQSQSRAIGEHLFERLAAQNRFLVKHLEMTGKVPDWIEAGA